MIFQQAVIDPGHKSPSGASRSCTSTAGDFAGGWPDYEQRWAQPGIVMQAFPAALRWGRAAEGEEPSSYKPDAGDTIQFVRCCPWSRARRQGLLVVNQPEPLRHGGADESSRPAFTAFDVHSALLSLPGLFGTTLTTIPANVPYLAADSKLIEHWRRELDDGGRWL